MTDHPTDAERFFFDNNGYLVLEDFLAPDRVADLYAALERTIERRRDSPATIFVDALDIVHRDVELVAPRILEGEKFVLPVAVLDDARAHVATGSTRPTSGSCTCWPKIRSFWKCSTTSR